ncbi:M43 family zinc metalloprotease [Actinoplanes sp. Pm04-4]|uniref:M43 family zinc metalloprotease n=1 Tax=Paractinoplanes pyxinae TaxID=2997416 RepID=A0ABT4AXZ7_9ACTN|nr:zinc-dependent metalloprotease family protein [Actinoplanes pyxinae]MCY1139117.1 M43 family zinc metalloprotease [Actinoplanes pyxinae]
MRPLRPPRDEEEPTGGGGAPPPPPPIRHLDINIIRVGFEDFTAEDDAELANAIQVTRAIYARVRLNLRTVTFWRISVSEAAEHAIIDSAAEAEDLTWDWTVPNDALDVFVVRVMNDADGWSAVDGSCDKNSKGMTGSVVSLNGDAANSANTLAHEVGHYLGLEHIPDDGNIVGNNGSSDAFTGIHAWQGVVMRRHCFVRA